MADSQNVLWVESMVSAKTGEPMVSISHGEKPIVQLRPAEARLVALLILEASEAAQQDAVMHRFVTETLGGSTTMADETIRELRATRSQTFGKEAQGG